MVKKMILHEFIKKNIVSYFGGLLALVSACSLALVLPKFLGYITDCLAASSKTTVEIYWLSFYMLLMAVLLFALKFTYRIFLIGKSRDLECFLREKLFAHFQLLSPSFYNNKKVGELIAYAINDLGAIRMSFAMGLVFLVEGILVNVVSLIVMFTTIDPILTALSIVPIIMAVFVILKLRTNIRRKFRIVQDVFGDLSDKIQENIMGVRVVKSYVQENTEIEKLNTLSLHRSDVSMDYVKISGVLSPITSVLFGLSFTLVLTVGGYFVVQDVISLGDFIAFNTYLGLLTGPINNLGRIVETWQRSLASMRRLDEIFWEKPEIFDEPDSIELDIKGNIEIRNLRFRYPMADRDALEDIQISVSEGKTLGIIGRTGSGKSTIINLLLRLYKIPDGLLYIDGVDINKIKLSCLRENIGCVMQDNFLFAAAIDENIKFFTQRYSEEDVKDSARFSSVYENIMDFPDQFQTIIGERGVTLSGGQRQRVSISRSVIVDPPIILLDDSLSAVDFKTEETILNNIRNLGKSKTVILVTQRVSTVKHADEIIFMDEGRIVERGTHESLLALKGEYYQLNSVQTKLSDLEDEDSQSPPA